MFSFFQVTEVMKQEITQLDMLVNEFKQPFCPYPKSLKTYKKVKIPCVDSFTVKQQLQ